MGKKTVPSKETVLEDRLIYPVLRGRDIFKWYSKPSSYAIIPHNFDGSPIEEEELKVDFMKTYLYFLNFKKHLENRAIQKLWGKKRPFYSVYDIGDYTYYPYKVCWKLISGKISGKGELEVALVSSVKDEFLGEKLAIPNHKIMFIPCKDENEAHYLSAVLNSSISQLIVMGYAIETGISTHVTNNVFIPQFNSKSLSHQKLSSLSKKAHELAKKYYEQNDLQAQKELKGVEEEIDKVVAELYGITDEELEEVKKTLRVLKGDEK
jgi:hypothetical protein